MKDKWLFLRGADWRLALAVLFLICFGLITVYSINLSQASDNFLLLKKQFLAFFLGLIIFFAVAWSNYRWVKSYATVLYVASLILLLAVLIFGQTVRGTTGWFSFFGFHFQPVEFAKVGLISMLARYFSYQSEKSGGWDLFWRSGFLTGLPVGLTLLQPDLGSALLLIGIWVFVLFFAGFRWLHFLWLSFFSAGSLILAWFFLFADYQKERLLSFISPASDPMGQGYNVQQAIIAVGSGGWFGRGLGFGSQSQLKFIPESQTDFIFAVIGEEFGFLGVVLLLLAFFFFFRRLLRIAAISRDDFTGFLILGTTALFLCSTVVNIGMNLGLLPVTGITLPFVSYGGSALIIYLFLFGLVESVVIHDVSAKDKM